jgi:hypothetical protein
MKIKRSTKALILNQQKATIEHLWLLADVKVVGLPDSPYSSFYGIVKEIKHSKADGFYLSVENPDTGEVWDVDFFQTFPHEWQ